MPGCLRVKRDTLHYTVYNYTIELTSVSIILNCTIHANCKVNLK